MYNQWSRFFSYQDHQTKVCSFLYLLNRYLKISFAAVPWLGPGFCVNGLILLVTSATNKRIPMTSWYGTVDIFHFTSVFGDILFDIFSPRKTGVSTGLHCDMLSFSNMVSVYRSWVNHYFLFFLSCVISFQGQISLSSVYNFNTSWFLRLS